MLSHADSTEGSPRFDTTAMIDVVFLLIVFFVSVDFRTLEGKLAQHLPLDVGITTGIVEPKFVVDVAVQIVAEGRREAGGPHDRERFRDRWIRWRVLGKEFAEPGGLQRGLRDAATAYATQDTATGLAKAPACLVVAGPGVRYDDMVRTADACRAAGYDDVSFGGPPR